MAEVWEGHDENLDRAVAIKMLHGHLSGDAGFVSRFRREALSIAKLSHPNVVAIFDTGVDQIPARSASEQNSTRAYIVMELIRGESLRAILQKGITMAKAVDIIRQAADGLAYAHRNGLVHRDVKPGNILVQSDGRVKVVDFGIAKLTDRRSDDPETSPWAPESPNQAGEDLTQVGTILGTAKYLAPEQVEGGVIDARSDIYSLGVVLYEGVCGRPPFPGKNDLATALKHVRETPDKPRQIRAGIPRSLEAVILKAMAKSPSERYSSADDLSAALRTIDFTPDDARPSISRAADDVTPTAMRRDDLPSSASHPPKPSSGNPPQIPGRVRAAYDAASTTSVTTNPGPGLDRTSVRLPTDAQNQPGPVSGQTRRIRVGRVIAAVGLAGLALGSGAGLVAASMNNAKLDGSTIALASATAYDPFGDDNEENDALAKDAIDDKLDTTWRTSGYRERNFNGTKSGVGIVVRLDRETSVSRLQVTSPSRSWSARIYVADSIPDDFSGWGPPVGSMPNVDRNTTTVTLTPKTGSVVLLWITRLSPKAASQDFTRVIIQEIQPRS